MPLPVAVVSFENSNNVNTDAASIAAYPQGLYFGNPPSNGIHAFPGERFASIGTPAFGTSGILVGTDGAATVSSNTNVGVSIIEVDVIGKAHVVAGHQLYGSRQNNKFLHQTERISDTVMDIVWATIVSLTTTTGGNKVFACGKVRVDSAAGTITELGRQTSTAPFHYHGTNQQGYNFTIGSDGIVYTTSKANNPNLLIGYIDPVAGVGSVIAKHVNTDTGIASAFENWNQGGQSPWVDDSGVAWLRASSRNTSSGLYTVHKGVLGPGSWGNSIEAAGLTNAQQSAMVAGSNIQGRDEARLDLWNGSLFGHKDSPSKIVGPLSSLQEVISTVIDPDTTPDYQDTSLQGSEATPSFRVFGGNFTAFNPPFTREYLADGTEHGAWELFSGAGSTYCMPCNIPRTRFVRFDNVNIIIYSYPTPNPLPVESGQRWWLGVTGWGAN